MLRGRDCSDQLAEVIMQFLELLVVPAWRNLVRTQVAEFGEVGEVVGGVVFSLTKLDSVELVVSSLTK